MRVKVDMFQSNWKLIKSKKYSMAVHNSLQTLSD